MLMKLTPAGGVKVGRTSWTYKLGVQVECIGKVGHSIVG